MFCQWRWFKKMKADKSFFFGNKTFYKCMSFQRDRHKKKESQQMISLVRSPLQSILVYCCCVLTYIHLSFDFYDHALTHTILINVAIIEQFLKTHCIWSGPFVFRSWRSKLMMIVFVYSSLQFFLSFDSIYPFYFYWTTNFTSVY